MVMESQRKMDKTQRKCVLNYDVYYIKFKYLYITRSNTIRDNIEVLNKYSFLFYLLQ